MGVLGSPFSLIGIIACFLGISASQEFHYFEQTGAANYHPQAGGVATSRCPINGDPGRVSRPAQTLGGGENPNPAYFWGRLSATAPYPYNAAASSGSNLAPPSQALLDTIQARIDALRAADLANTEPIPVDLVTAAGSGLDPHISVAPAEYQVPRVARARGLEEATLRDLVSRYTEKRQFGILGEPRVNVLLLNLALDQVVPMDTES